MFNKDTDPRRVKCAPVRAFQTDPSWYEAYWYSDPELKGPSFFKRSTARPVSMFKRPAVSLGECAEILHSGVAWASRSPLRRLTEQR
jgi:hypothetical protein